MEALAPITGARIGKITPRRSVPTRPQPRRETTNIPTPQRRTDLWTFPQLPRVAITSTPFQSFSTLTRCGKLTRATYTGGKAAVEENPPTYTTGKLKENTYILVNGQCVKALVDSGVDYSFISAYPKNYADG
ncbi:hypothetical protein HNY73_010637 [Argiope bruennichi]|uniref:Uncharacterized protein n=1 Tax=Argiope bruennichi TaxID=94029 RepID=A0A8T0F2I1_ARGBR|nr:hypothetical protein HNY73_010637 [Argiope bruennichi]